MKLSEFINKLQETLNTYGDRDVYTRVPLDDTYAETVPIGSNDGEGRVIYIMNNGNSYYCDDESQINQYFLQ